MSKLQQNGRHSSHAFVLLPCHVCDELVKLHGLEFHVRKSIIEDLIEDQNLINLSSCIMNNIYKINQTVTYKTKMKNSSNEES